MMDRVKPKELKDVTKEGVIKQLHGVAWSNQISRNKEIRVYKMVTEIIKNIRCRILVITKRNHDILKAMAIDG